MRGSLHQQSYLLVIGLKQTRTTRVVDIPETLILISRYGNRPDQNRSRFIIGNRAILSENVQIFRCTHQVMQSFFLKVVSFMHFLERSRIQNKDLSSKNSTINIDFYPLIPKNVSYQNSPKDLPEIQKSSLKFSISKINQNLGFKVTSRICVNKCKFGMPQGSQKT